MNDEIEQIKEELILKLNKLKQTEGYMKDFLRTEYDGYVGIYYTEDLIGIPFFTFEIYKSNKLIVHETLDKKLVQEELDTKLKDYVNKKKEQEEQR